jgi:hypothetical protein
MMRLMGRGFRVRTQPCSGSSRALEGKVPTFANLHDLIRRTGDLGPRSGTPTTATPADPSDYPHPAAAERKVVELTPIAAVNPG